MQCNSSAIAVAVAFVVIALAPVGRASAFPDQPVLPATEIIDSPMFKSPDLPRPKVEWVFPQNAIKLWLAALARPDAETKYKAADAIARARGQGVKGLEPAVTPLLKLLEQPGEHSTVRVAAARALVALDARSTAPQLFQQLQSADDDLRDVIEPALARWDYRPMRTIWLARCNDAEPRSRQLVLAIGGLAQVREEEAVEPLRKIVLSDRAPPTHRLEAARALGQLREAGLEKDAEGLAADTASTQFVGRLCAVRLLERHSSPAAIQLLQRLTLDKQPTVAGDAVERLLALDAKLVVPSLKGILANADARVRSLGVEVLFRKPSAEHIGLLSQRLDDVHPDVRGKARQSLRELAAKKEWREHIIPRTTEVLASRSWRGLEQATLLLAQLDHKPAAARFAELLDFDRPEVYIAAAWGLRKLNVRETLPAAVEHIKSRVVQLSNTPRDPRARLQYAIVEHELSQLLQFIGMQRYTQADALLRTFIPRASRGHPAPMEARAAAIWSLGMLHEGKNPPDLAALLVERLTDTASRPPEDFRVRWMCALSLGRMKAKEWLTSIAAQRLSSEPSDDPVSNASGWAVEQITGEKMPPPRTIRKPQPGWFLTPRE
jgi:HEAT repeat protein